MQEGIVSCSGASCASGHGCCHGDMRACPLHLSMIMCVCVCVCVCYICSSGVLFSAVAFEEMGGRSCH